MIASSQAASLLGDVLRQLTETLLPRAANKEAAGPVDHTDSSETDPFPTLLEGMFQEQNPQGADSGPVSAFHLLLGAPAVTNSDEHMSASVAKTVAVLPGVAPEGKVAISPALSVGGASPASIAPLQGPKSLDDESGQAAVTEPEARKQSPLGPTSTVMPLTNAVPSHLPSVDQPQTVSVPSPAIPIANTNLDSQSVSTDDAQTSDSALVETAAGTESPANISRSETTRNQSQHGQAINPADVAKVIVGPRALRPGLAAAQPIRKVSKKDIPGTGRVSLPTSHNAPELKPHARIDTRQIGGQSDQQPGVSPDSFTAANESSAIALAHSSNLQQPVQTEAPILDYAKPPNLDRPLGRKQSKLGSDLSIGHSVAVQAIADSPAKARPVDAPIDPSRVPPADISQECGESSQHADKSPLALPELAAPVMPSPVPFTTTPDVRPTAPIRSVSTGDAGEKRNETVRLTDTPGGRSGRAPDNPAGLPDTWGPTSDQFWRNATVAESRDSDALADLAFHGRLVPVAEKVELTGKDRPALRPDLLDRGLPIPAPTADPLEAGDTPVEAVGSAQLHTNTRDSRSADTTPEPDANPADRERKLATVRDKAAEPDIAGSRIIPPDTRAPQPSASADATHAKSAAAPTGRATTVLEPELPKALAPTRDIKVEVSSGDKRVELHVVDQGGDVHVAVRTPDSHLAGELRENLPTLSSRLEQTGLRAEEWHTATPVNTEWHRQVEYTAGSHSYDPNGQQSGHQGRGRQDDPEQPPKRPEQATDPNEKGKEFAWFMPSPI